MYLGLSHIFVPIQPNYMSFVTITWIRDRINQVKKINQNLILTCILHVVVNFVISGNFYFSLAYITIPKNKRKTKITSDKK